MVPGDWRQGEQRRGLDVVSKPHVGVDIGTTCATRALTEGLCTGGQVGIEVASRVYKVSMGSGDVGGVGSSGVHYWQR